MRATSPGAFSAYHVASDPGLTAWATACEFGRAVRIGEPTHDPGTNTYTFPGSVIRYRLDLIRVDGRAYRWAVFAEEN